MSRLTIEKLFVIITKNGDIKLSDKTTMHYCWTDVDYIMKDVKINVYDDHIMLIEGIKAEHRFTYDPLYLEDISPEDKERMLPISKKNIRKSIFNKKEYIRGSYSLWEDHETKIYTKFDNYNIIIEP